MTRISDPLLYEALRLFPAYQDVVARVMPGDCDPLTVDPRDVAEAFEELPNDATVRLAYLMIANGYTNTRFESCALLGQLFRMVADGRRPRYAGELGIA